MQLTHIIRTPRDHNPRCKLSVLLETKGPMPVDFDEASDFALPVRYAFFDHLVPAVQRRARDFPAGASGSGLVCKTFKAVGHGECDLWITLCVSRPVPSAELETMIEAYIDRPIVSRRLKSAFQQDRQGHRIACHRARTRSHELVPAAA